MSVKTIRGIRIDEKAESRVPTPHVEHQPQIAQEAIDVNSDRGNVIVARLSEAVK